MTAFDVAGFVVRACLFGTILVAVGCAAFRFAILSRLSGPGATEVIRRSELLAARTGAIAGSLAVAFALARFPLQLHDIRDPGSAMGPQASALVFHTLWGKAWFAQVFAAALTAFGFAFSDADRNGGWVFASLAALGLAFTPALSGHAIASERLVTLAVLADGLHVVAAGAWLGAMVLLWLTIVIPRDTKHAAIAAAMVAAFSPMALGSAAVSATTGAFGAWLHVGVLSALWQSRYGRGVLLKVGAVALMAALGAFNWRRGGPNLKQSNDIAPMRRSIRAELVMGILVLLATAALVVTPPPGEE